jgi:hypothetical protein
MTLAEHPASANLLQAALRSPWAAQCLGSPASSQRDRNQLPNPFAVNASPYRVTSKTFIPVIAAASMIRRNSG